ncbi:MAG TPA: hypothetical protein VGD78_15010 [Chthoniobacterales bacterium]
MAAAPGQQPTPLTPDSQLTPGDVFDVTASDLCVSGYTKTVRNVPAALKREIYTAYGITEHHRGEYECDHRAT